MIFTTDAQLLDEIIVDVQTRWSEQPAFVLNSVLPTNPLDWFFFDQAQMTVFLMTGYHITGKGPRMQEWKVVQKGRERGF